MTTIQFTLRAVACAGIVIGSICLGASLIARVTDRTRERLELIGYTAYGITASLGVLGIVGIVP